MIRVWMLAIALALPLVAMAGASAAETGADADGEAQEKNGWTPGLTGSLNIYNFDGDGRVMSDVGQSVMGSGHLTVGQFRLGLDLLSPAVDLKFVEPRLVMFGGVQVGPTYTIRATSVGELAQNQPEASIIAAISASGPPNNTPIPPNSAFAGQGAFIDATYDGFGWYAGAGAEFDIPRLEDLIRIRPYVLYVGEKMAGNGALTSVAGAVPNYIIHRHLSGAEEDFHYIGPGLELDLVLAGSERMEVVFFTAGDFLFNVGDGEIELQGTTTTTDQNGLPVVTAPGNVTYLYSTPGFRFNLQFGLRVAWKNMFGG